VQASRVTRAGDDGPFATVVGSADAGYVFYLKGNPLPITLANGKPMARKTVLSRLATAANEWCTEHLTTHPVRDES
jgi:hypothetical protein